jgi:hypothetical protein
LIGSIFHPPSRTLKGFYMADETPPSTEPESSVPSLIQAACKRISAFKAVISASKRLAQDSRSLCDEMQEILDALTDRYDEEVRGFMPLDDHEENATDMRVTLIHQLRDIVDLNPDATLRFALEYFLETLGPVWEDQSLPTDPMHYRKLVRN